MNLWLGLLFLDPVACILSSVSHNQSAAVATCWVKLHLAWIEREHPNSEHQTEYSYGHQRTLFGELLELTCHYESILIKWDFVPDSAKNFPVSLCWKARPGFFFISIFGAFATGALGFSEGFSLILSTGTDSRELIISLTRDSSEFLNTVPSLLLRQKSNHSNEG